MNALLLAWLLAAGDPGAAAAADPDPFREEVFGRLEASRDECLRGVLKRFTPAMSARCGFTRLKTKHFLRAWEGAFPGDVYPAGVVPLSGWTTTLGGWISRYFEVDGVPAVVAYGGRQAGLVVGYFARYPDCPAGDAALSRAGVDGVSRPQRIAAEWLQAAYPLPARQRRINGMVLVRAVIDASGQISSLCVLDEQPPGYGFKDSAVETLGQHRYEPARRGGTPVAVQQPMVQIFEID